MSTDHSQSPEEVIRQAFRRNDPASIPDHLRSHPEALRRLYLARTTSDPFPLDCVETHSGRYFEELEGTPFLTSRSLLTLFRLATVPWVYCWQGVRFPLPYLRPRVLVFFALAAQSFPATFRDRSYLRVILQRQLRFVRSYAEVLDLPHLREPLIEEKRLNDAIDLGRLQSPEGFLNDNPTATPSQLLGLTWLLASVTHLDGIHIFHNRNLPENLGVSMLDNHREVFHRDLLARCLLLPLEDLLYPVPRALFSLDTPAISRCLPVRPLRTLHYHLYHEFDSVGELLSSPDDYLLSIPGIGPVTLQRLREFTP